MNHPLIIAHRAQSDGSPENARSSIQLAASLGADLIELDVRLTLDRRPVIIHDPLIGRTTTGRGPVALWPSPLLGRVPLRSGLHGEHIPSLRSVLEQAPATVQLALHVKSRGAIGAVLRTIRKYGSAARTWLWLDRMEDIYTATRALPELRCTLLRPGAWTPSQRSEYFHNAQAAGARAVSVPPRAVVPDLVRHAHQHHLLVFSRLDSPEMLPELVENGLDGAITANPGRAAGILRELGYRA